MEHVKSCTAQQWYYMYVHTEAAECIAHQMRRYTQTNTKQAVHRQLSTHGNNLVAMHMTERWNHCRDTHMYLHQTLALLRYIQHVYAAQHKTQQRDASSQTLQAVYTHA